MFDPGMSTLIRFIRRSFFSVILGIGAGSAAFALLALLHLVTNFRDTHPEIIWFLPLAGLALGFIFHYLGRSVEGGTGLILEEIHSPRKVIPFRMAPLVLFGTVLTHLFGGSAGREGTAVQMGASLADQLSRFFNIDNEERRILLIAGTGAGFSAAIGAPFAGTIFGLEVMQIGRLRFFALVECMISSFVAFYTCRALGAPHTPYPEVHVSSFAFESFITAAFAGVAFGLAVHVFIKLTHTVETIQKRIFTYPPLRPFAAGIVLVLLFQAEGTLRFAGLGLTAIIEAFASPSGWTDPLLKLGFTALTIGSGWKGGEFIPLVFVGTTLGSFLSSMLPVSTPLLAALGFASAFGAAANTPLACAVMATEIFGLSVAPYAILSCWIAYYVTGHVGIYKNQKVMRSKKEQLLLPFKWRWPRPSKNQKK